MSGTATNINSKTSVKGSRNGKKKRRRIGDTITKASDKILHSQQQLADAVFPKDSYVVKMPTKKIRAKNNAVQDQFEDAPEFAEKQLRQNRTDSFGAKPPFGYFSLHPSTLMLHPPHATYWYYPANTSWMRHPPPPPPPPPSNTVQPQFHQQQHSNLDSIGKVPSRSVSQPGLTTMSPHQQIPIAQQKGYLEFARRNRQQEQIRQQEVYKESLQQKQQQRNKQREEHYQLQQQESTAVVLAGMRAQPTTISTQAAAAAAHAAQMKTIPVVHTALTVGLVAENKAAKYLGHLSSASSAATQQQHRPPPPPANQEQPKITNVPTRQQQKPLAQATGTFEDASLDENGAGARQFIKRMIITTSEESPLTTGMDKLETLPMLPYTPPDSKNPVRETEITNCDVLVSSSGEAVFLFLCFCSLWKWIHHFFSWGEEE
jgi:hypothetical protein